MKKIAWGITGAGHFLEESMAVLEQYRDVDVYVSKAAEEVIEMYKMSDMLENRMVYREQSASSPLIGKLYKDHYDMLIISPATSNSVAKFVVGISDNLITNLFAHAGKNGVPILVLPCDTKSEVHSKTPKDIVTINPRKIDLENSEKLQYMENVTVVNDPEALQRYLSQEIGIREAENQ